MINLYNQNVKSICLWPCYAGQLYEVRSTLAYAFIKAGAAPYMANTAVEGTGEIKSRFAEHIQNRMRIGDAFVRPIFESIAQAGGTCNRKIATYQYCLYGDPTLKRR
jgi:hypothetical protein